MSCSLILNRQVQEPRLIVGVALSAVLFLSTGCSGSHNAEVTGTVTRSDGSPLVNARISARSQGDGKTVYGTTDGEGRYSLSTGDPTAGVPPGDYQVGISEDLGDAEQQKPSTIAAKYVNPSKSGLAFSVAVGEQKTFDIVVEPR